MLLFNTQIQIFSLSAVLAFLPSGQREQTSVLMTGIRCQFLVLRPGWWCQGWNLEQSTSSVCWHKTSWARAHLAKLWQSTRQVSKSSFSTPLRSSPKINNRTRDKYYNWTLTWQDKLYLLCLIDVLDNKMMQKKIMGICEICVLWFQGQITLNQTIISKHIYSNAGLSYSPSNTHRPPEQEGVVWSIERLLLQKVNEG